MLFNRSTTFILAALLSTLCCLSIKGSTVAPSAAQAALTVRVKPENAGSVVPSASTLVSVDVAVQIIATPAADFGFAGWEVFEGVAVIADPLLPTTSVTVSGDATIIANFSPVVKASLTLSASPTGSGTTEPTGTVVCVVGAPVAISATGSGLYHFANWTASTNAAFDDPYAESTIVTITGDTTVTAHFSLYVIEVGVVKFDSSHAESVSGLGPRAVTESASLTAEIVANLTHETIDSTTVFSVDFDDGTFLFEKTMKDAGSSFKNKFGKGGCATVTDLFDGRKGVTANLRWDEYKVKISLVITPLPTRLQRQNLLDIRGDVYGQGDAKGKVMLDNSATCVFSFGNYRWPAVVIDYKGKGKSTFSPPLVDELVSWSVKGAGSIDQYQINQ